MRGQSLALALAAGWLLLGTLPGAWAQSEKQTPVEKSQARPQAKRQPGEWKGTWSASGGSWPLSGSWTATEGDNPYAAYGTWAVLDASGKTAASGTWSASKAEKRWEGAWQARIGSSAATFAGTWSARSPIVSPTTLTDMFEFAITNAFTGEWHLGPRGKPVRSGGWSIRAYPRQ
jgi:hypothetical protein